jgi:hypothetical protein
MTDDRSYVYVHEVEPGAWKLGEWWEQDWYLEIVDAVIALEAPPLEASEDLLSSR